MVSDKQLTGRHQDTFEKIFVHPLSHNVDWREVVALLHEVAEVEEREDRVRVTGGGRTVVLTRPRDKDVDADELMDVRHFLEDLGYRPSAG